MKWFRKHLNWTFVFSVLAWLPIYFTIGLFTGFQIDEDLAAALAYLIDLILIIFVTGWVVKQKGRALWWILMLFVPFGPLVILCLENRNISEPA